MLVKELQEELNKFNGDMEVYICAGDGYFGGMDVLDVMGIYEMEAPEIYDGCEDDEEVLEYKVVNIDAFNVEALVEKFTHYELDNCTKNDIVRFEKIIADKKTRQIDRLKSDLG